MVAVLRLLASDFTPEKDSARVYRLSTQMPVKYHKNGCLSPLNAVNYRAISEHKNYYLKALYCTRSCRISEA